MTVNEIHAELIALGFTKKDGYGDYWLGHVRAVLRDGSSRVNGLPSVRLSVYIYPKTYAAGSFQVSKKGTFDWARFKKCLADAQAFAEKVTSARKAEADKREAETCQIVRQRLTKVTDKPVPPNVTVDWYGSTKGNGCTLTIRNAPDRSFCITINTSNQKRIVEAFLDLAREISEEDTGES